MTRYHCWVDGWHEEGGGVEVEALDPEDAAGDACDAWNDRGSFAGDPIPDFIGVYVRDLETLELFTVDVTPDYSVSFYGRNAKKVDEPTKTG